MTQSPYSQYSPYRSKSANQPEAFETMPILNIGNFNPFQSQLANYGAFAGGGGLAGAGIGALIQALRGKSKLKGALIGGGIGTGAGVGIKGLADVLAPNAQGLFRDYIRSGYLEGKAKDKDDEALKSYNERTADTWANSFKNKFFGAPKEVPGNENAEEARAAGEAMKSLSIFQAIKDDEKIRHGRTVADAAHAVEDWWNKKK